MAFALTNGGRLLKSKVISRGFGGTLSNYLTTAGNSDPSFLPSGRLLSPSLLTSSFKVKKLSTASAVSLTEMDTNVVPPKRIRTASTSRSSKGEKPHSKHKEIIWPPIRKGMTVLDKSAFDKDISIPTIVIFEDQIHPDILRQVKPFLLKIQGIKPIQDDDGNRPMADENNASRKTKRVYLNPDLLKKKDFATFVREEIKLEPISIATICHDTVKFKYENWTWTQLFDSVLPDEHDKVSSFSQVGHVVQLNLRDHHLPYKNFIGQVYLDKINHTKTIVNKLGNIDNTYRNFQMEILAGDPNTVVHLKENRCEYEFDFAHVYWNSRLSAEHERLVKWLQFDEVLYDVFAGVGPFSVPAAKKKTVVVANDLNPESYKWLVHNVKKNKVQDLVRCFNQDGRDFIKQTLANDLMEIIKRSTNVDSCEAFDFVNKKIHVAMNLPAIAVEFLDAFWGILEEIDLNSLNPNMTVIVHVYCFIKDAESFKEKALKLVEENLNYQLPKDNVLEIIMVRNVAPNKEMLRVSFILPHSILTNASSTNPRKRKLSAAEDA